jgi:uncharacterized protein YbaP (TraB family)
MNPVLVTRRTVCCALAAVGSLQRAFADQTTRTAGPRLWLATRGSGSVYLFAFGEAKDSSWFTQRCKDAFASSADLWLEVGPPPPNDRLDTLYEELGHESGRTLFDVLDPSVRARTFQYMQELNISPASVQTSKPWLAYYTFTTAFDQKYGHFQGMQEAPAPQLPPDWVLAGQALQDHKPIYFEYTMEALFRKFAAMPEKAQGEYLSWLFDWFDDEKKGLNRDRFDWMDGHLVSRSIDRMRTKYPDLYEIMDGQRNRWWVKTIDDLLSRGGTHFVAIGQDHFADSRGIKTLLMTGGIVKPSGLRLVGGP